MEKIMGTEKGLKTAVRQAHDPGAPVPGAQPAEQLPLVAFDNSPADVAARDENGSGPRGRGRPPGAQNRSTKAWTEFLLARYRSPLEGLAEIAFTPTGELGDRLLGMTGEAPGTRLTYERVVELLKIQLGAMKELAPYLHKKQPIEIDGGDAGLINLFIGNNVVGHVAAKEATNFDLESLEFETVENQGLSENSAPEFNGRQSNDDEQVFVITE